MINGLVSRKGLYSTSIHILNNPKLTSSNSYLIGHIFSTTIFSVSSCYQSIVSVVFKCIKCMFLGLFSLKNIYVDNWFNSHNWFKSILNYKHASIIENVFITIRNVFMYRVSIWNNNTDTQLVNIIYVLFIYVYKCSM